MLRAAGIEVRCGLLANEARELNIGFVSRMKRGRPWVRLKVAVSLDGRTGCDRRQPVDHRRSGARRRSCLSRARVAVLTGVGTVLDDNPRLTCAPVDTPRQPLRVLIDASSTAAGRAHSGRRAHADLLRHRSSVSRARCRAARRGAEIVRWRTRPARSICRAC